MKREDVRNVMYTDCNYAVHVVYKVNYIQSVEVAHTSTEYTTWGT
jgi:hypothetical protein